MFIRTLFVLLLALNLGGAAWLLFGQAPRVAPPPPSDPGVPRLVLLAERDGAVNDAELASAPESPAELASDRCQTLGPFPTQADMHAAMVVLTPLTKRMRTREARITHARGYWVYLPAMANREEALATARSLSQKGVRDYYIVTAGAQENTISLGLFRDPANAERRSADIGKLGFTPKTDVRTEDVPVYWLDYALTDQGPPDWRGLLADARDLHEEDIACR
ncbi:SPOR domain-containing protein [Dokdonella sp.]|uniref:SPOR domain-containing protein n=1 Tax=Dokdonella sp. TaxID=2291710 RepID=UPI0031C3C93B|nr:SPOR domain-containing protein [Dokdonella sp.]